MWVNTKMTSIISNSSLKLLFERCSTTIYTIASVAKNILKKNFKILAMISAKTEEKFKKSERKNLKKILVYNRVNFGRLVANNLLR